MRAALNQIASLLWSIGSALARRFAGKRLSLSARVISVGNIQVGGAGKTPIVAWIARQAHERGLSVCILCRGYGAEWETRGGTVSPGETAPATQVCGDEAALLHELAPNAWIGVGADRARQFTAVRTRAGGKIDLVILDDGFQNHRLKKDLEIVAVTSAGRSQKVFRDFHSALGWADLIVWTKGDQRPDDRGKPLVRIRFEVPTAPSVAKTVLVTGLADGAFAAESARKAGYQITKHVVFPDHARYAEPVVTPIVEQARAEGLKIAVTGKDWVKWREIVPEAWRDSFVFVLEPEVRLDSEGEKVWNRVLWGS